MPLTPTNPNQKAMRRIGFTTGSIIRASVLFLFFGGYAGTSMLANAADEMQTLLLLLDDTGLAIEKRLPEPSQAQNTNSNSVERVDEGRSRLLAAIRSGSGGNKAMTDVADGAFSSASGLLTPNARWYSSTGELLAITEFVDPRILRAPQQGSRAHGPSVTRAVSRFLLRGPLAAEGLEIFLPDISARLEILPKILPRVGAVSPGASQPVVESATTSLSEQTWRFDL